MAGQAWGMHGDSPHPQKVTLTAPNSSSNSSVAVAHGIPILLHLGCLVPGNSGTGKTGWPELVAPHIKTSQSIRDRAGAEVSRTLSPRVSAIQAPEQPGDSSARELARKIMGKPR